MTFPKARAVVAAILFVAWLGFLLYLVIDSRRIVLSTPQFLAAQAYLLVNITSGSRGDAYPHHTVSVDSVLWASTMGDADVPKGEIRILQLADCTAAHGYRGEGKYLVPVIKSVDGWHLAPIPRFTNYPGPQSPLRIYRWTPDVEAQAKDLIAAK